jgi:hypothetical protein
MKSSVKQLIRLGALMSAKYANIDANTIKDRVKDTITNAVANASSGQMGIMPFVKMLKDDQANMNINVTRNGDTVTVTAPSLSRPELASKYNPLSEQIRRYLTKYMDVFPTVLNGNRISYDNLTITLSYIGEPEGEPIAGLPQ